ncbi:hypothetical protein J3A83DRAFT_4227416 [Scleroderma citrinum]
MVFGLFIRKSTSVAGDASLPEFTKPNEPEARLPTPTPSTISLPASARQSPLRFPTSLRAVFGSELVGRGDAESSVEDPPVTPSPPPPPPIVADTKPLHNLMLTIPAKTLHAYTLAHLRPQSSSVTSAPAGNGAPTSDPDPPSPETIGKLQKFFATLAPPPLLHCARCHSDFYDIENEEKDKACRVPHDDESALVSRIPGAGYETLWGCCGQTAAGDGGEGPPDGWCYEGRHTTDMKRARFRADSTIYNDKLTSCLKLNCHGIRDQLPQPGSGAAHQRQSHSSPARKSNPSPARSRAESTRKRPRKSLKDASSSEDEHAGEQGSVRKGKSKQKETSMVVVNVPRLPSTKPANQRPLSRARPPCSTSTASLCAGSTASLSPPPVASVSVHKASDGTPRKPKSDAVAKPKTVSRTLLSQSHVHGASDSDASSRARPRTRSLGREPSQVRRLMPEVTLLWLLRSLYWSTVYVCYFLRRAQLVSLFYY